MRHGKPYFRVDARSHITLGRDERKATLAKHKAVIQKRFASRDEAEAAKPNDDNLEVVECTPIYGVL